MYFPGALCAYLERTELEDLSGDALILLVNIFDEDSVESASELFINKLFDAKPHIVDASVLNCIISVILICAPYYERKFKGANLIFSKFMETDKSRDEYKAFLIELTNRGASYRLECCMETIRYMIDSK